MLSSHVLCWRFNQLNIELYHHTRGQDVRVLYRGRELTANWIGFIYAEDAKKLDHAKPVRIIASRLARADNLVSRESMDVPKGSYVHGCLVGQDVYAVVDTKVRLVK